ncbi:MAG TPA: hypothetical protein V6C84_20445 [Coleofasciculaceae cyanobacterium]|jgi:hypothetical protein
MTITRIKSILSSSARFLAIAFACTLIMLSSVAPAFAGGAPTDPRTGSARLDSIQEKSEEILQKPPLNLEETQAEAKKGINEIQGDSDIRDMSRPSNSRSVKSAAERVTEALENVTGKN